MAFLASLEDEFRKKTKKSNWLIEEYVADKRKGR